VLQALVKKGRVIPVDMPAPLADPGTVLVKTVRSCVSAGTEMADVSRSADGLVRRALKQPGAAWKFLNVLGSEGLEAAVARVTGSRDIGSPIGYSAAGIVLAAGSAADGLRAGDRVAVAGVGIANHAEYIQAPRPMLARIADAVSFDDASTAALGAIALQAVRRASPAVGELAVVYGVGTIGQIVVQILAASGARVAAVDLDGARLGAAAAHGAERCVNPREEDLAAAVRAWTGGRGADVVLYCASAGDEKALSQCASMARRKGRLVLVGAWSGGIERSALYPRELDVLISTSYGPGRYDERYESGAVDYPYSYVRWTEGRNLEEYLRLLACGKVSLDGLMEDPYPIGRAGEAFERLQGRPRPLFVILDYGTQLPGTLSALSMPPRSVSTPARRPAVRGDRIRVGIIGAGRFATSVHLPNLAALSRRFEIRAVCSRTGPSALAAARRFGASYGTTDYAEVLADPAVDLVLVCTGAALHGRIALESLEAGKNTFVEKPLCTTVEDLGRLDDLLSDRGAGSPLLAVGYNRRFSPYAQAVRQLVSSRLNPLLLRYRMNAGPAAGDPSQGPVDGGRIVGEACHLVDLASFLAGSTVRAFGSATLNPAAGAAGETMSISLEYEDGSLAAIDYFSLGSPELPKESLEVHFDGKSVLVDNYQLMRGFGVKVDALAAPSPLKGHREQLEVLADCLAGTRDGWPIAWECLRETTEITFALAGVGGAAAAGGGESAAGNGERSVPVGGRAQAG
jgi:predicted dehydrogenase/threonine dehydrogenase-like Zn-dependent dehydrogenase